MTFASAGSAGRLRIEHHSGPAGLLHQRCPPSDSELSVWVLDADRPAVVLGSTQDPGIVDARRAGEAGFEVVSRRSGGGAVLLLPGEHLWVDFWVPRGHALFDDDVVRAAFWAGQLWAAVAEEVIGAPAAVRRAALASGEHGSTVCFAGAGPGEVFVNGRKLVGISQRRTRDWTRIQTLVHQRWRPAVLLALLGIEGERAAGLEAELAALACTAQREPLLSALRDFLDR